MLEELLQNGQVNVEALEEDLKKEHGPDFSYGTFENAWRVIEAYNKTGGEGVQGGTGLPKTERE